MFVYNLVIKIHGEFMGEYVFHGALILTFHGWVEFHGSMIFILW